MATYHVIYEEADDGSWSARVADLPVYAAGETRSEAEAEIRDAIRFYLEWLEENGENPRRLPSEVGHVTV